MSLEEVAQDVADELRLPVVIFDTEMHVVAFSSHESTVDSARKEIILSRRGSATSAAMIAEFHVGSASRPVRIPARADVPSRILVPLRHQDRLVGYLSCVDADAQLGLVPAEVQLLENAATRLGELLAVRRLEEVDGRELTRDLLSRLIGDSSEARADAAAQVTAGGHLTRSDSYAIVLLELARVTDRPRPSSRLAVADAAATLLHSIGPGALAAEVSATGWMLALPSPVDHALVNRTLARPDYNGVRAGVGGARALTELHSSRHEADIALRYAQLAPMPHAPASVFSQLGLDALLIQLPLETLTVADLPGPLRALFAAPKPAVLLQTLNAYLAAGGDAGLTARRLHVHRSTLYYRLDKLRSLTSIDLADGDIRRELHTGLRVAELAGLWSSGS